MMIKCDECGKDVSDKANSCPNCGAPVVPQAPAPEQPENIPERPVPPRKKKRIGCLIPIIVLSIFGFIIALFLPRTLENESRTGTESVSQEESYKEFDEQSWGDFKAVYKAHRNFLNAVSDYNDGKVSTVDFYNFCKKAESYFMKLQFGYGKTEEQKKYLSNFRDLAVSDQTAASQLVKYLDSYQTKNLSTAKNGLESASNSALYIVAGRPEILQLAGYSDKQIEKKTDAMLAEIEEIESK